MATKDQVKQAAAEAAAEEAAETRAPVTERGVDLIALINSSDAGYLMLTRAEAGELVQAGHAAIDTSIGTVGDGENQLAAVRVTDAGNAAANAPSVNEAQVAQPATRPTFEIEAVEFEAIKPKRGNGGGSREPLYPFDKLEVGQSFHVPVTEKTPKPWVKLSSSVSGFNAKSASDHPTETETVTVRLYAKGQDGKFLKDADGKRIPAGSNTVTRPKRVPGKVLAVYQVGANDPKGPGARVKRES